MSERFARFNLCRPALYAFPAGRADDLRLSVFPLSLPVLRQIFICDVQENSFVYVVVQRSDAYCRIELFSFLSYFSKRGGGRIFFLAWRGGSRNFKGQRGGHRGHVRGLLPGVR